MEDEGSPLFFLLGDAMYVDELRHSVFTLAGANHGESAANS